MALQSDRLSGNARLNGASAQRPLAKGERGRAVEILQDCLIDLGHAMPRSTSRSGLTDGIFGSETEATIKKFQSANALKPDGMAGPMTLAKLDAIFAEREHRERMRHQFEMNALPPVRRWNAT